MNEQPLTPTHSGKHAPAKSLYQGSAEAKALLAPKDLAFLLGGNVSNADWAVAASQKNSNVDRFLDALEIRRPRPDIEWSLVWSLSIDEESVYTPTDDVPPREATLRWLQSKPFAWHQRLYVWLEHYVTQSDNHGIIKARLKRACLVRLGTGEYKTGDKCFFPSAGIEKDARLPRVAKQVYTSGKNNTEQGCAKAFLTRIGVREVREAEEVEALLKERYDGAIRMPDDTHFDDLKRFMTLAEKEPERSGLFCRFPIFWGDDEKWHRPSDIFLDSPYEDTGLAAYYDGRGLHKLSDRYQCYGGKERKRLVAFAKAVGVKFALEIEETTCRGNPYWHDLACVPGERSRSPIDRDFEIPWLDDVLERPSVALSKLVWRTMCQLPDKSDSNPLQATYQMSKRGGQRHAPSQLVHLLRTAAWVPQGDGKFVRPAQADLARLPDGFRFDPGCAWLKAIQFGEDSETRRKARSQEHAMARRWGFRDAQTAERFGALSHEQQKRFLAAAERERDAEMPDSEPADPERRAQRVAEEAADSPNRKKEKRLRSVAKEYDAVKEEARQYLRPEYTSDGKTICQVCQAPLPFKLAGGQYYFEAVEFLPELKGKKHYHRNHLALCPNHAAMFKHANGSKGTLVSSFLHLDGQELPVVLAGEETAIYFTKKHIIDLKALIKADQDAAEEA